MKNRLKRVKILFTVGTQGPAYIIYNNQFSKKYRVDLKSLLVVDSREIFDWERAYANSRNAISATLKERKLHKGTVIGGYLKVERTISNILLKSDSLNNLETALLSDVLKNDAYYYGNIDKLIKKYEERP